MIPVAFLALAAVAADAATWSLDPHPGLPTHAECHAFYVQARREMYELGKAADALGWPEGGGWNAQRLRTWHDEAERVAAYWEAAMEARHPAFTFRCQAEAAAICRRMEADGLDVRPFAIRELITLRD